MYGAVPQSGDVVIHQQIHSPAVYILGMIGGPLQFSYTEYEEAVTRATAFAVKARIDAWYTTDEQIFERVAQHRPVAVLATLA